MPFHRYDHAKEFKEIINMLLRESKAPGIVDVYKLERKSIFVYHYSGGFFKLNATERDGSMEVYTSDDILDQIEDIINNSYGLMILL